MPTRGSHRPVRAYIRAYGSSDHGFAAFLSPSRTRSASLPSPGSGGEPFARFVGTIKALSHPAVRPAALRYLRLAVPPRSLVLFAPRRTSAPPWPGVVNPVSPAGMPQRERQDLPSSWGTPMSVCHVQSTPAGLLAPDQYGATAWPLVCEKQRLPRKIFRRSIAWLSDSLSTLRRAGYPTSTQDSLPAVGQTLPDGLSTRRVPTKGFRALPTSRSPFPSLLGAITSTEACRTDARKREKSDSLGRTIPPGVSHSCVPNQTQ